MLAACDAVIVNTSHEGDFVREHTVARIEVAGVGVDAKSFERRSGNEIRARYRLGSYPVVGFVGRQTPGKGAPKLLQSMRTVWKWNDEVRLVLAGPQSPTEKDREAMTAALTQFEKERIIRVDDFPEADKASIFESFDVFVLPSKAESFGIAYLEAWLCRKPVIGARVGSTQCVIDEGTNGLLVDPDDPLDIARAIIDLLSDADKREKMGNSGYAKTIAEFTWEKVTNKIERLYLDLLAVKSNCRQK
jgi:glycosyltransferase involved in cell wall biosynthesis